MKKNDDEILAGLFAVLFGAGLFLLGYAFWAIVCFVIAAIMAYFQYQTYLDEAEDEFDEIVRELGADLPVGDVLESLGIEVPQADGYESIADWMAGTSMAPLL